MHVYWSTAHQACIGVGAQHIKANIKHQSKHQGRHQTSVHQESIAQRCGNYSKERGERPFRGRYGPYRSRAMKRGRAGP
eukprot:scaffold19203_cov23-Tisochrysis_lutea.AAC.1